MKRDNKALKISPVNKPHKAGTLPEISRRSFIGKAGLGALLGVPFIACSTSGKTLRKPPPADNSIQGFERMPENRNISNEWVPVSDRRIRVGIIGYGYCRFGADFGFQDHPNVDVIAVSDLFPDRCAALAKACRCKKTYPSLEELVKDDNIEAVFIATDAPGHVRHAIEALRHGKHVASAVPAAFGSVEEADKLFEAVKESGLKYMMFETSCFREDLYAMNRIYLSGGFGKISFAEGEYYHYMPESLPSYLDWRVGLPPQWYPTHSNAYYIGVTGGYFTGVSCIGVPGSVDHLKAQNNRYRNSYGTEIAHFKTSDGGAARMAVSWDTPGDSGERGRVRGQRGTFYDKYQGLEKNLPLTDKPPLPPGVPAGGHGGSHGHLMNEFILSIIQDRRPLIDITMALNMTVPGIIAHQSALRNGELMRIPHYYL